MLKTMSLTGDDRARRAGQRRTDRVPFDEYLTVLSGTLAGAVLGLQLDAASPIRRASLLVLGAGAGASTLFAAIRHHRRREFMWRSISCASLFVVAFATVVVLWAAPTPVVATVNPEVQSAGPVPISSTTCTVDVTGGIPVPDPDCGTSVRVETRGEPQGRVSGWMLPSQVRLLLLHPDADDGRLVKVTSDAPECVLDNDAVAARRRLSDRGWLDAANVLLINEAPPGTRIYLYEECGNLNDGWLITIG